jgi:hypothetical protein
VNIDAATLFHLGKILEGHFGRVLVSPDFFESVVTQLSGDYSHVCVSSHLRGRVAVRLHDDSPAFVVIALDAVGEESAQPLIDGSASPDQFLPT